MCCILWAIVLCLYALIATASPSAELGAAHYCFVLFLAAILGLDMWLSLLYRSSILLWQKKEIKEFVTSGGVGLVPGTISMLD
jgi:hypothetical protein